MYLEVTVGTQRPVTYRLSRPDVSVGSLLTNEIVVSSPSVSKQHLRIFFQEDRWFLIDPGSTNGTFMDGEMILREVRVEFPLGAEVRIGEDTKLRLLATPSSGRVQELPATPTPVTGLPMEKTVRLSLEEFKKAQQKALLRERRTRRAPEKFFIWDTKMILKVGIAFVLLLTLSAVLKRTWETSGNMAREESINLPKGGSLWERGPAQEK